MSKYLFLVPCLLLSMIGAATASVFVPAGSSWKYFIGTQEASSPDPAAWRLVGFDDATWATGAAPIGYGEPDIVTSIPSSTAGNWLSVFFRKTFVVSNPTNVAELDLFIRIDDGYVVWINGS